MSDLTFTEKEVLTAINGGARLMVERGRGQRLTTGKKVSTHTFTRLVSNKLIAPDVNTASGATSYKITPAGAEYILKTA